MSHTHKKTNIPIKLYFMVDVTKKEYFDFKYVTFM